MWRDKARLMDILLACREAEEYISKEPESDA